MTVATVKRNVQPRSAFALNPFAAIALTIVAIALLAALGFVAAQFAPHVVSAVQSLIHSVTSGAQPTACGIVPGSCFAPVKA